MRKITRLLALFVALFLVGIATSFAKQQATSVLVPSYIVNETFTGAIAYPTGWAVATTLVGANNGTVSWTVPATDQFNVAGAGTGTRGISMSFPTSGTEPTVYVDFDWLNTTATLGMRNAVGLILHDNAGNNILSLYACGSDAKFHYWNQDLDSAAFIGNSFNRASALTVDNTNSMNYQTLVNFPFAVATWYNIKATLNFTTHIVTNLTITKKSDGTNISIANMPFISTLASDVTKISLLNTRASNAGNGSNANLNASLDNFKTYKLIDVPAASVNINYLDPVGTPFKTARVETNQAIGSTYTVLASDKATYTDGLFYYVYDAAATATLAGIGTGDTVVVKSGGSTINLKFTKVAAVSGTYIWTGTTNANWNESDANFTTDGSNSLAYQNTNAISFPATAIQKTVNLTVALNMGTQSINLAGDGYTLIGNGSITGSKSALNLNLTSGQTATLNFINNLDSVVVNGGKAVISSDASGKKYCLADGTKLTLQTGVAFAKPVIGTGSITIETISNVNYNNTLTGASTINYILGSAGSLSSSTWSNGVNTVMPASTLNVSTTTGVASGFGVSDASLTNAKVSLGDNIRLLKSYNQSSGVGSTISVGELSGSASSTLEGGFVAARILNYNIGGLNTDATFAGTIKNYIQIASPTAVNTDILNIYKKGTGIWTLTGTSPLFTVGSFNVDAGRVIMYGSLGSTAVPVTVAATGTLSGTGTFAGATTVNGILEGPLNFGSTLTLAGTTNITGTGFDAGQFDVVNVIGAVTNGGTLNITIAAAEPTASVSIKVINAATYVGTFTAVNVSPAATSASGWGYNHSTGVLTYYPLGTGINAEFSNVNIYPTLTRGDVHVNADNVSSIDVVSLTGQLVKQVKTTATTSIINLNGLSTGAYFVKVRFADGSVKAQRILLQK